MERIIDGIPPTLEGWVYIIPIHEPLDEPLYTWAQYTPTLTVLMIFFDVYILANKLFSFLHITSEV